MYGIKQNEALYDADIIVEDGTTIYLGKVKPGYNRTGNTPVTSMPIWQIERIDTNEVEHLGKQLTVTTRKYPNGNEDYRFVIDNCTNLTYEYRH